MTSKKPFLIGSTQSVTVSWSWISTTQGVINWTFKNNGSAPVYFVLLRGVSVNGSVPENKYLFGDAFYPLYYYDFGTAFASGQPSPLTASITQPPLAMIKTPNGVIQAAFIYTLKSGGSWTMEEAGWVDGMQPAGIEAIPVQYASTEKFSVNYNKQISCEQYNAQAGTNYPCPPDPFTVESAMFLLSQNISPEVPSDSITPISSGSSSSTGTQGGVESCLNMIIQGVSGGSLREVVEGLVCLFDNGIGADNADLKAKVDGLRRVF
ncbi:MAG: hypothetical protein QXL94_04285 [Candidatus Parvarchaeum sp.]